LVDPFAGGLGEWSGIGGGGVAYQGSVDDGPVAEIRQYIWPTLTTFQQATAAGADALALDHIQKGERVLTLSERAI
jgi:hypothetical protein